MYIIALVLGRSVILSSESHNSVTFCPIFTSLVPKSMLRTSLTNDIKFIDGSVLKTKIFISNLCNFFGIPGTCNR